MLLFKTLGFEKYLYVLSKIYFAAYQTRILKFSDTYKYHYYLKKIIRKGDVIIDIGANLGYFSVLFAKWTGKNGSVHAVEPVEPVRNILEKNIRKYSNVIVYPFALGDEDKEIQMANNSSAVYGYITSGTHFVHTHSYTHTLVRSGSI